MPDRDKPPVHFSNSDPWRDYRLAVRRAEAGQPPPRHFSKQGAHAKAQQRAPGLMLPQDPWREYRFALRRAAERLKSDLVPIAQAASTPRNSLGGSSNYRGALAVHI